MTKNKWRLAKDVTDSNFKDRDWVRIFDVYYHLGGRTKLFTFHNASGVKYRILGLVNEEYALASQKGSTDAVIIPRADIKTFPKTFKELEEPTNITYSISEDIRDMIKGSLSLDPKSNNIII